MLSDTLFAVVEMTPFVESTWLLAVLAAVAVALVAWSWPGNARSMAVFVFSVIPAVWILREARTLAQDASRGPYDWLSDAVAATLVASSTGLMVASIAATWSLLRRAPLRRPEWVIVLMICAYIPVLLWWLFGALGPAIFALGE